MADRPGSVGLLGGGVIGGGWAARLLLNGVDVRLYDPDPRAPEVLAGMLENARRAYAKLTLVPLPEEGDLHWAESVPDAVAGVQLVQESAPERLELKRELLAQASRAAPATVPICSSTSGLRPTELAADVEHPQRLLVAHPFNPVYLLPLVELCGGAATEAVTVEEAARIYRAVGMAPLVVRNEIDGFIADRLLEALWREALWLVHDGVATVQEIDDAVRFGAGLRWALMGTFMTYRIAGGPEGMRHFMAQFGPTLKAPWTKLTEVPELTPAFLDTIAAQSDEQAEGRSIPELERWRDDGLIAVLHGLRTQDAGAGATLSEWERTLRSDVEPAGADTGDAPLRLITREVPAAWIDYNEHVHESRYLQLFGDATDALLTRLGIGPDAVVQAGASFHTVETRLTHLRPLLAGDRVTVSTQVLGADHKRLHLLHEIARGDEPAARAEQMLLHVDTTSGRAAAMAVPLQVRVKALADAHAHLPRPAPAPSLASRLA
ncbi:MAG: carnitine 3-dehydrogenase, partial [Actinomycetota bacterium]|nr:carnitine 3-dehydrogenase [Actinomycetota bacterium]